MSNIQTDPPAAPDTDEVIELDDTDLIEIIDDLDDVTGGCRHCRIGGVAYTHTTGGGFGIDPAFALLAMAVISQNSGSK